MQDGFLIAIYRVLLGLLSPVALLVLWLEGRKRGGGKRFIKERLGILSSQGERCRFWFHAASVGEVNAIHPLIQIASQRGAVLVTTNTPEAARLVARQFPANVTHHYCPLDFAWAIRGLLGHFQPKYLFITETELWPNLFRVCKQSNVPIVIVNGRLSKKTLESNALAKHLYRDALACVAEVWARSERDAEGFVKLGCEQDRIRVLGNIKFAGAMANMSEPDVQNLPEIPYVLAASTHADEEVRLGAIWRELAHPPLLVIIPRHPPRGGEVVSQLRDQGLDVAQRSRKEAIADDTQVYVADTLGELNAFATKADWVFMGGSLVDVGGHNMLEPASLGKAIVTGWSLENFKQESDYLRARDALWVAQDLEELQQMFTNLLANTGVRADLEQNAAQAMQEASSVLEDYAAEFERLVG